MKSSIFTFQNKIFVSIRWIVIEKIFRMGLNLVVGVLLARYLGTSLYGSLNYTQAILSILVIAVGLGLDGIVVRNLVSSPDLRKDIMSTVLYMKLISGLLIYIAVVIISIYTINDPEILLLNLFIFLILIFQSITVVDFWLQSKTNSKITALLNVLSTFLGAILKITAIVTNQPIWVFGMLFAIETLIIAIGFAVYGFKNHLFNDSRFSLKIAKSLLKDSWPLMISNFAVIIYMKIDQIMIGWMLSSEDVGIYSVAVKMAELWYFIPLSIITATFPTLIKLKKQSNKNYKKKMQLLYDLMSTLGFFVAVLTTIFSELIIETLYGVDYFKASEILTIYIWAGIFVNIGSARSTHLKIINETKFHLYSSLLGCLINIALNLLLIPKFGIVGSAYATLFSYWVQAHLSCYMKKSMVETGNMLTKSLLIPFRISKVLKEIKSSGII